MLKTCMPPKSSLQTTSKTLVSVPAAEIQDKHGAVVHGPHASSAAKLTLYKVAVCDGPEEWFVFRRYNEFRELRDVVRRAFPRERIPAFPGKRVFGNNFDPEFVKARKEGLHEFVQKVVSIEEAMNLKEVREFFKLDKPMRESTSSNEGSTMCESGYSSSTSASPTNDSPMSVERMNLGSSERPTSRPSDFEFLKVIGKGSYGKVFLARRKMDHGIYAVKVLAKKSIIKRGEAHHVMAERNVLVTNLNHPFLAGLHYSFQTREKLYFVLDYVNGGELFFHLQRDRVFTEPRARFYAAEITTALGYLHSKGIVYRDLKPENLLLDADGHVVLTDFGLCKQGLKAPGETTSTFCGTPEYLAPEVLRKEPYDRAVDWWCLGAVLFEMLCGLPPFYSRDTNEMYDGILNKSLRFRQAVSMNARDLLEGLLDKDQRHRLGAGPGDEQEIRSHPFFAPIDWDALIQRRVTPPFRPDLTNAMDLRNIDPEFTKEPVPASVGASLGISASVKDPDNVFQGFSYAPPTVYR